FRCAIVVIPTVICGVFIPQALLIVGVGVAIGVVVFGMRSRRPWLRWMGVAFQAVAATMSVVVLVTEEDFSVLLSFVLSVAVIVLLLTPTAAAWFDAAMEER